MWTPASLAFPDVVCQSLSAAAPFIQSQQAPFSRIHSPSCTISLSPFSFTLPTLPRITSQCLAGCLTPPFSPTPPAHFLPFCKPVLLHPSTLLGPDEPLWDSSRWMGNKGVRGGPPLPVPLVSLPTRLWVIFSSFHGRAMNNLSLLSETRATPQPPPSYLTLCRLARAGCSPDSISHPRFLLTVSALHTQSGFFFLFLGACYKARRLIGAVAGWHLVPAS